MATVLYYTLPGGAFGSSVFETDGDAVDVLPHDAEPITEAEYNALFAAHEKAQLEKIAADEAAELALKKTAYDALVGAGFVPSVAATLSGYTPTEPPSTDDVAG